MPIRAPGLNGMVTTHGRTMCVHASSFSIGCTISTAAGAHRPWILAAWPGCQPPTASWLGAGQNLDSHLIIVSLVPHLNFIPGGAWPRTAALGAGLCWFTSHHCQFGSISLSTLCATSQFYIQKHVGAPGANHPAAHGRAC